MRTLEYIKKQPHICITDVIPGDVDPVGAIGWCDFPDKKFRGTLIIGCNEDGWEHVSVSSYKKRQLPDWDIMCRLKEAFWEDEEMVVQIHPKKSEYVHGVGDLGNVLHLWRPVGGDWSRMEKG